MHRKSKQWLKGIDTSHISRCLAVMVIIMTFSLVIGSSVKAQEESGTLEDLLNKLEDLQTGDQGFPSFEEGSPLDQSREKSFDRSSESSTAFARRQRNIEREQTLGGFTMREQFLIQKFCDGTIKDQVEKKTEIQ